MVKYIITSLFFLLCFKSITFSQPDRKIDSLNSLLQKSVTADEKVAIYAKLAELYFIYQLDKKGDSILQKQLQIAEFSNNTDLILQALFGTAILNVSTYRSSESFEIALKFINKGLLYAKQISREDLITVSYIRLAGIFRKRGQIDNGFYHANFAFTSSLNINNDSIKILATIELGDAYNARGESLLAFKAYTSAYDKSVELEYTILQSEVLHSFSELYKTLGNKIAAKENLIASMDLNKKFQNDEGLIKDYIDLSRLTDELEYLNKGLALAEKLKLEKYIIRCKQIMWGYYTYVIANSDSTLQFLNRNPDVKQTYINAGISKYNWMMGSVFHYANKPDSALHYLKIAETGFNKDFDVKARQALYEEIADCYKLKKQYAQSIHYYEKANDLLLEDFDIGFAANYASSLSSLYENIEDFKNAFIYAKKSKNLKDSLQKLSNLRDITLIEVDNEKKKHDLELAVSEASKIKTRNLQYMAITIAITIIFLLLIIIGMFPTSRISIKLMGYFAFISLFEFFIVIFDSFIHELAHGEPLKIWLCKVALIAMMVPFQHYLEHGLVTFLESGKFKKLRSKINFKNWGRFFKKRKAPSIDEIEEDTAVL